MPEYKIPYFLDYRLDLSQAGNSFTFPCHEYSGFSVQFKQGNTAIIVARQTNDDPSQIANPVWFTVKGYDPIAETTFTTLSSPSVVDYAAVGAWGKIEVVSAGTGTGIVRIFLKKTRPISSVNLIPNTSPILTDSVNGLKLPQYDYVSVSYPSTIQEVYVFKVGGASGTTVATVTLNYTDTSKANLSSAVKT